MYHNVNLIRRKTLRFCNCFKLDLADYSYLKLHMCIYEVSQSIFMGGYRLVIIQKSVIVIAVTKYRILFLCHRIS